MSERRPNSPNERGGDWSDEERSSPAHRRDKFRRDRSLERDRFDDFERSGKRRNQRSVSPYDDHRYKRRPSLSPSPYPRRSHDRDHAYPPDGDYYIPQYDRDGYNPQPRHGRGEPRSNSNMGSRENWSGASRAGSRMRVDLDQLDRMVTFQEFSHEFRYNHSRGRYDDDELQRRYAKYKEDFTARQLPAFFDNNKEKKWFEERYHPILSLPRRAEVHERRRHNLQQFLEKMDQGEFDPIQYDKEAQPEAMADVSSATEQEESPEKYMSPLVIKSVPPTMPRQTIIDMCSQVDGFESIALSEPNPNKKFHRICWIHFKEGTDMEKAFNMLDEQKVKLEEPKSNTDDAKGQADEPKLKDFVFHLGDDKKLIDRKPKNALEIMDTDRLRTDLDQAQRLIKALDKDLGIENEGLPRVKERARQVVAGQGEQGSTEESEIQGIKKELDMMLLYLRNVHMFCYYCGLQFDSTEELSRRCMEPHCRTINSYPDGKPTERDERRALLRLKELDQRIRLKLDEETELERQIEDELAKELVQKEHDEKYKCKVQGCTKAFKGFDFVSKHIQSKHSDAFKPLKERIQYYNNYVCDPNRLLPSSPPNNTILSARMMPVPMPMAAAPFGDQVLRMGFPTMPRHDSQRQIPISMMGFDDSHSRNSRQLKSYVDLDAPAKGDENISFY